MTRDGPDRTRHQPWWSGGAAHYGTHASGPVERDWRLARAARGQGEHKAPERKARGARECAGNVSHGGAHAGEGGKDGELLTVHYEGQEGVFGDGDDEVERWPKGFGAGSDGGGRMLRVVLGGC